MGPIGVQEMVVIFLVALVLFGPKKLPELGKTIAKAVTEFRRAQADLKATFEREMQAIERENESLKEVTRQTAVDLTTYSEIDLVGAPGGTYDQRPGEATPDHPTVSASEVPGAELPAVPSESSSEAASAAQHQAPPDAASEIKTPLVQGNVEGTVPRGASLTASSPAGGAQTEAKSGAEPPDSDLLPAFEQPGSRPSRQPEAELPSIV
jgi:sec-independent protein translocase protein TatA